MTPPTYYDAGFFRDQSDGSLAGAREILPLVFALVPVTSVLDVGCGVGTWIAVARDVGVTDVLGVDGSYVNRAMLRVPEQCFYPHDLAAPLELQRKFDLVLSMEVAEHIDPSAADTFIDSLVRHGDIILFSAAIPGQGGTDHVNERWPQYWQTKFESRGYQQLDCLRYRIWENDSIPRWYRQNAFLYVRRDRITSYPGLVQMTDTPRPVALIHPKVFAAALDQPMGLRRILRDLPRALRRAFWRRIQRLI
jgi:SAM-dependent methyltransferase